MAYLDTLFSTSSGSRCNFPSSWASIASSFTLINETVPKFGMSWPYRNMVSGTWMLILLATVVSSQVFGISGKLSYCYVWNLSSCHWYVAGKNASYDYVIVGGMYTSSQRHSLVLTFYCRGYSWIGNSHSVGGKPIAFSCSNWGRRILRNRQWQC